jgi:dsRNA-specific ribonuclease
VGLKFEALLKLRKFFKPKWQHSDRSVRLKALSRITDAAVLRRIVEESDDERLQLDAAQRIGDNDLVGTIARCAKEPAVRLEAALAVGEQSCLAAIALNDWAIERGLKAVEGIANHMVLRRIARSAKQDAIRLAAAIKLDHPKLLKEVARSSNLVDIHWKVARRLNDPQLMAEVTLFRPCSSRLEPLRRKAKNALMAYLDQCRQKEDSRSLLSVMQSIPHLSFKLEAFVRLPPEAVTPAVLRFLTRQNFRYVKKTLVEQMLTQIKLGGWLIWPTREERACVHCKGSGQLSLKCISANNTWFDQDVFHCPECGGMGKTTFVLAICRNPSGDQAVFRMPQ